VPGLRAPGETAYARQLLHRLTRDMLVLTDRGFDAAAFLEAVAATKAQLLARLTAARRPPVMARLDDGTFISRIGGALTVRIIEAEVIVTLADGTRYYGCYPLATTLLDHRRYPAAALIRLYHERWEHEMGHCWYRSSCAVFSWLCSLPAVGFLLGRGPAGAGVEARRRPCPAFA
jgi:hypothetical protein